jgi:hypothetical protein
VHLFSDEPLHALDGVFLFEGEVEWLDERN